MPAIIIKPLLWIYLISTGVGTYSMSDSPENFTPINNIITIQDKSKINIVFTSMR